MDARKASVLIADDNTSTRETLGGILESEYFVLTAQSASEVINVAHNAFPDLILLDRALPGMQNFDICLKLKEDPRTAEIPILLLLSREPGKEEIPGLERGASDYLVRPCQPPFVRARVKAHIDLKRHKDMLRDLSLIDGLTGIANRRRFNEFLELEWRRNLRNQTPLSLVIMDLDHFKLFNENYGPIAGDDCLKRVATALQSAIQRPGDLVARFGNEEFACVLPETDTLGAVAVAERMRAEINGLAIPHVNSPTSPILTVSVGTATTVPQANASTDKLVRTAERLLVDAKRGGRNLVLFG